MGLNQLSGKQIKQTALDDSLIAKDTITGDKIKDHTLTDVDLASDANISIAKLNQEELMELINDVMDGGTF